MLISALYIDSWKLIFKKNRVIILRVEKLIIVNSYRGVYSIVVIVSRA
jgi:hypothetical protein